MWEHVVRLVMTIDMSPWIGSARPYRMDTRWIVKTDSVASLVYFVICDDSLQREDTVTSPYQWEEKGR